MICKKGESHVYDVPMTWNYRLMTLDGGKTLGVHEVYYDESDQPVMYNPHATSLRGRNVEEIRGTLQSFAAALDKPVLTPDKFPDDGDSHLEREYLF